MKYMGSKNRYAKQLLPLILKEHNPNHWYFEPFVGGCNMIDKVDKTIAPLRCGSDVHPYLMAMWKAVSGGWTPPKNFTEEEYKAIQNNKEDYPPELVGYVGFALSYGGKWFGGWRRDSKGIRDYVNEAYRNAMKQFPRLAGVRFINKSVFDVDLKTPCTIYCDPPYKGTTGYNTTKFNHDAFYDWCRLHKDKGCRVFVSEYVMPEDFRCIWGKEVKNSLTKNTGGKSGIERLYTL